ncbi:alpha/beta fold hydrolase [Patescibacteria group bacterium]|nr:alpha/beta fold hydrolase [Patescibacteria group bacterium]MBU1034863.1 alpha/beta fold hydrolase [Patescibacteria group bacterium]MBU1629795.1 alpha/beta fold hydrolase [Patescibacteria group bacterium]MBU1907778.1 alpha/beta fold hydrolase [Patescibacteria group bacterium]
MQVILIHGYLGFPENNWFPWLKTELLSRGYEVTIPSMPNPALPVEEEWVEKLKTLIHDPESTILVGHSLGCAAILHYLQNYKDPQFQGIVLVAGFGREFLKLEKFFGWFKQPLDFSKIKKAAKKWICIHSKNDRLVPFAEGEWLSKKIGAEFVVQNNGHFLKQEGVIELPAVLEAIESF